MNNDIFIIMTFKFPIKYLTKVCDFVSSLYSFYGEVDFCIKSDFNFMEIECTFKTTHAFIKCTNELKILEELND